MSQRLDPGVGAVRGNIALQVTFCPLRYLGIAADRYVPTKLRRSDPAELSYSDSQVTVLGLARPQLMFGTLSLYKAS
ncbi:hypothetical protein Acr_20g0002740 [Actinidia rufa]|uniref:Uncharacterized protein n=1 Tax=Actinidia rufa TaxID=165716 RepID=A0A7J0GCC7_9ERIC|nr:hypothetical protein Acr_20g0002740 [Actinidia rufa]